VMCGAGLDAVRQTSRVFSARLSEGGLSEAALANAGWAKPARVQDMDSGFDGRNAQLDKDLRVRYALSPRLCTAQTIR